MAEFVKIEDLVKQPVAKTVAEPAPVVEPIPEMEHVEPASTLQVAEEVEQLQDDEAVLDPEETADIIIDVVDAIQSALLPKAYEAAAFSAADKKVLDQVLAKIDTQDVKKSYDVGDDEEVKITFSRKELYQLQKYKKLQKYENDIVPFKERDRKLLRKPLMRLVENSNVDMSPTSALLFTSIVITAPRLMPLVGAMKSKNK